MDRSVWKGILLIGMVSVAGLAFAQQHKPVADLSSQPSASARKTSAVSTTRRLYVAAGETLVEATPLCKQKQKNIQACGMAVDPCQPEFELYTNKLVLLRIAKAHAWQDDKSFQGLAAIASAEPRGVIVIAEEGAVVDGFPAFPFPVVAVAAKDSLLVIQAAGKRQQISIVVR